MRAFSVRRAGLVLSADAWRTTLKPTTLLAADVATLTGCTAGRELVEAAKVKVSVESEGEALRANASLPVLGVTESGTRLREPFLPTVTQTS